MPNIFGAASRAAVVELTCPKCGEVQARARDTEGTKRFCRKCGAPLPEPREQSEKPR